MLALTVHVLKGAEVQDVLQSLWSTIPQQNGWKWVPLPPAPGPCPTGTRGMEKQGPKQSRELGVGFQRGQVGARHTT